MALAIAAPTIPSTIFISNPISLFMSCSASQPAIPPMIMAAIQPISRSPMARLLRVAALHPSFPCARPRAVMVNEDLSRASQFEEPQDEVALGLAGLAQGV